MRILVVQESDWLEKGPHQSHHLMERLSRLGHEIRVIDFEILWKLDKTGSILARRRVFENVHKATNDGFVTVVRPSFVRIPLIDYVSLVVTHGREIRRQIVTFKPNIVVGFGILNSHLAIRSACSAEIPFIYYLIDELHLLLPQRSLRGFARVIEKWNIEKANLVVSINEGLREYTIRMGADPDRTCVIPAGIDLEKFGVASERMIVRRDLGIRDSEVVLFFMGWLYDFSGLLELAEELGKNPAEYEDFKMVILGRGDIWDELHRMRNNLHMEDRMILIDWKPYSEIPRLLAASDVCILPAWKNDVMRNIVPIKMYEYMAAGKPVVATDLPGIRKEFGTDNGVFYVDTPEQVLKKIRQLRECNGLEKAGAKARKHVLKNDWSLIAKEFEEVLAGAVKSQ
jgi:glycosyltransferase involved in cell wall biosynthesis